MCPMRPEHCTRVTAQTLIAERGFRPTDIDGILDSITLAGLNREHPLTGEALYPRVEIERTVAQLVRTVPLTRPRKSTRSDSLGVRVRVPDDLLAKIDAAAERAHLGRPAAMRALIARGLKQSR